MQPPLPSSSGTLLKRAKESAESSQHSRIAHTVKLDSGVLNSAAIESRWKGSDRSTHILLITTGACSQKAGQAAQRSCRPSDSSDIVGCMKKETVRGGNTPSSIGCETAFKLSAHDEEKNFQAKFDSQACLPKWMTKWNSDSDQRTICMFFENLLPVREPPALSNMPKRKDDEKTKLTADSLSEGYVPSKHSARALCPGFQRVAFDSLYINSRS